MFTGLVLGTGEVTGLSPGSGESRLTIRTRFPAPDWVKGESICVSGVCLSVETFAGDAFTAYASRETLRVSTLAELGRGSLVNLERALSLGDRLGGHMVSGHVDAIAVIESVASQGSSLRIRVSFPEEYSAQVIPKGSVALDGISLTINGCGPGFLEVNVIPETQETTTIGLWKRGTRINFETDLIGKYVQNMLGVWRAPPSANSSLTLDYLKENGF